MMAGVVRTTARRLLREYPCATNTLTFASLYGLGDICAQGIQCGYIERNGDHAPRKTVFSIDWKRTARITSLGLFLGATSHYWYFFLDSFLPGRTARTVVKKLVLDQTLASPLITFTFLVGAGTLEGQQFKDCLLELRLKFWTIFLADCAVWPPAQLINFYFLPPHLRVFYISVVALCWDTFLCYTKQKDYTSNLQPNI